MRAVRLWVILATCAAVACAGGMGSRSDTAAMEAAARAAGPPLAETCAVRLPPREPDASAAAPPPASFDVPLSTLRVDVEVPLARVREALDARVPRRVAEERDHDLGRAGRLEYAVDRGPFAVRVDGTSLVVETMLQGRAQACAKGRCYAGCAPQARATARVPMRLGADYRLRTSDVRIDVTQGCTVRVLGGLLSLDVTPILRSVLAGRAREVQASIDRELPEMRGDAQRLWSGLASPRPLPFGACVVLSPEQILQGSAAPGGADLARLRFALLARPEVRMSCGGPPATEKPLPPLRDDPALPAAGEVHLAIVLPPEAPGRALEGGVIPMGAGRARVSRVSGEAGSGLGLELAGEVCGDVLMRATGAAFRDPQSLLLTGAVPLAGEEERLASSGVSSAGVARWMETAPIALPISVEGLGTMLPALAAGLSDERVAIAVAIASAAPGSAGLRGADVVAVARLRGAVTIRPK